MKIEDLKILGSEETGDEILSVLVKDGLVRRILKSITIDRVVKKELQSFSESDKNNVLMRFCSEKGISKNDELVQFLNVNGLTKENLVDSLLRPLAIKEYRNRRWEGEVLGYYYENKELYDIVEFNLLIVNNSNLAQEL